MRLPVYQVDAFTEHVFQGNPAAIVPLDHWLDDATMQAIAAEHNLAETAFFVPLPEEADGHTPAYELRWFTPAVEVDLCGHATLASAHVIFEHLVHGAGAVRFHTRSGWLSVRRTGGRLAMDFPSRPATPVPDPPADLASVLGVGAIVHVGAARDLLVVVESQDAVRAASPDMGRVAALPWFGVIVTGPGDAGVDFVSRFFAPRQGVPEDPVTGSAHCTLVPYWAHRLGRTRLRARQVSPRSGDLWCELSGDRVGVAGHAVEYLVGEISVPAPLAAGARP